MSQKEFDIWNENKKGIQNKDFIPYFYERELWFISMGLNVGFEQDGKGGVFNRPVIILKKFNKDVFWGIPLTSTEKTGKYYFDFVSNKGKKSVAILSQLKLFSSKRLVSKIGDIGEPDFKRLKGKIKNLID